MSISSIYILGQNGDIAAFKSYMGENNRKIALEFYQEFLKISKQSNNQEKQQQYPLIKIKDHYICAFITFVDIIFLAIVKEEVPVLMIYNVLYHLMDILKNGFKEQLCFDRVKANFAQVMVMLDHFLDNGKPLVSQKFVLEEISKPSGVMDKIGDLVVGQNKQSEVQFQALEKYAEGLQSINNSSQWVVKGQEYDNQIFFDLTEYYDCQIDKNGKYLMEEINGELKLDSKVTDGVELDIYFSVPHEFDDISGHECLQEDEKLEKLQQDKMLNCIPPTGQSSLFFYNISNQSCRIPFEFIHSLTFEKNETVLNLKLEHRLVRGQSYNVDELHVKLVIPREATVKESNPTVGSIYDQDSAVIWKIGTLKNQESAKWRLYLKSKQEGVDLSQFNFIACLRFSIEQFSLSGTKIEKAQIRKGPENTVKKAKNITKSGYYEIRLN